MVRGFLHSWKVVTDASPKTDSDVHHEHLHKRQQAIKNWPVEPQTLNETSTSWFMSFGPHIALLLISAGSIGRYVLETYIGMADCYLRAGHCSI
jgi:hypothetical protein